MMTGTPPAALYARISKDDRGLEKGVTQQLADCRALAQARGWTVAGEWVDNDRSAWNGAEREQYRALMAAATAGEFDAIVVYHASRLWRAAPERAGDVERLGKAGVTLVASGMELDLSTATGRQLARQLGDPDTVESDVKSERVARAARREAENGRRASGAAAYGWARVREHDRSGRVTAWWDAEEPAEAEIVREIVARILDGDPVTAIARDLNTRGVPAPRGRSWSRSSVRAVALRDANAGLLRFKGELLDVPAQWPALVDRGDHERVRALLARRGNGKQTRPARRKYLLSHGVGFCGVCGGPLRGRHKNNSASTVFDIYQCAQKGCTGRNRERVDALVGAVVVARLARPDAAQVFAPNDEAARQAYDVADALRARLAGAADSYANGAIDKAQLERITAKLRPELERALAEAQRLAAAGDLEVLQPMLGERAAETWAALDVVRRRRVLEVLGLQVVIMPTRQGPGFDPRSVRVDWRPTGG